LKKILVIRLSSIGDIVLTTPLIRCIKKQSSDVEIHYLTKKQYLPILESNPYIDRILTLEKKISEVVPLLKEQNYDHIIDLHKNIRSKGIILSLKKPSTSFSKLNFKKWLFVNFKLNMMPDIHIVDRYFEAAKDFNIVNDGEGLDYFITEKDEVDIYVFPENFRNGFIGMVVGSKQATKQIPQDKMISICNLINKPIILLGGKEDFDKAEYIVSKTGGFVLNCCGKFNINQSASVVKQSKLMITSDTGLMHIAAAFRKKIISLWGNTVPSFGMYPYLPVAIKNNSSVFEVKGITCRPCSKLGYKQCPRGHFACMNYILDDEVAAKAVEFFEL
jgi:ADP-heptose:LPS heptosyltransferase